MTHAYNEIYVYMAQLRLADMLEYAVLDLQYNPDEFFKLFLESSIARKLEIGHPSYVAGKSGIELVVEVLEETDYQIVHIPKAYHQDKSDLYWAGWILAYLQWYTNMRYEIIWSSISIRKLQKLYPTLHEVDIEKAIEVLISMIKQPIKKDIHTLRIAKGYSQAQLANIAHVSISQIQRLEYGERKVENLSLKTALSLADTLGVDVKELK